MTEQAKKYRVLSLGVGVQSSTMLMMCAHGEIAPPDFIIFSDPGWEPKKVHEYLAYLQEQLKNFPDMPEIIVTSKGNIREDLLRAAKEGTRVASIPFFVKSIHQKVLATDAEGNATAVKETWDTGQVIRQCTMEYKVEPVRKKIRELTGFTGKRTTDSKGNPKLIVEMMLGISTDEEQRMKESPEKWIVNDYPLIEAGLSRYECLEWMASKGYMLPPKSACIGCPYHSNKMWSEMKVNDPEAFADVVFVDNAIRHMPRLDGEVYLHRSLKPLGEINFTEQTGLFDDDNISCMCGL